MPKHYDMKLYRRYRCKAPYLTCLTLWKELLNGPTVTVQKKKEIPTSTDPQPANNYHSSSLDMENIKKYRK
jgi:hypothetical protein